MKKISMSTLKIIAIISMLIDHLGYTQLFNYKKVLTTLDYSTMQSYMHIYDVMRGVGRLAFPIFCFCLVEGYKKTSSVKKYLLRLIIFAVISEIPFNLALSNNIFYPSHQNVLFDLALGLITLIIIDYLKNKLASRPYISSLLILLTITSSCIIAFCTKLDYKYYGIIAIVVINYFYYIPSYRLIATALCFIWEPIAMLSVIPMYFYNGNRGLKLKYFFYIFYPAHLLLLYLYFTYESSRLF